MTQRIPDTHPLTRMFRGITEYTFATELGVADPKLVDYVAGLLVRFVPTNEIWKLRSADGTRFFDLASMIAEAESVSDENRRRDCYRHVGDYTLFWTGIFPESLGAEKRPSVCSKTVSGAHSSIDALINFQQQGKRSYFVASTLSRETEESVLYRRLSDGFETCAFGLSRVRKEWERRDSSRPQRPIFPIMPSSP